MEKAVAGFLKLILWQDAFLFVCLFFQLCKKCNHCWLTHKTGERVWGQEQILHINFLLLYTMKMSLAFDIISFLTGSVFHVLIVSIPIFLHVFPQHIPESTTCECQVFPVWNRTSQLSHFNILTFNQPQHHNQDFVFLWSFYTV